MSGRAVVDAMNSEHPSSTRTAPPRPPDHFWTRGNYLGYIAFGATGILMALVAFGLLRRVWVLGEGEAAWNALLQSTSHPLYLLWHTLALVGLTWFALRFFKVFPKTQPSKVGPFPVPADGVIRLVLNVVFVVATSVVALVLGGAVL